MGGVSRSCTCVPASATLLSLSNYTRYPPTLCPKCVLVLCLSQAIEYSPLSAFLSVSLYLSIYICLSLCLDLGREGYINFGMTFNRTIVQDSICYVLWLLLASVSMILQISKLPETFFTFLLAKG